MRAAISFPGCHRRGGVERVMLECVNFMAARGHDTHAFASVWDVESIAAEVVRHQVDFSAPIGALEPPAYLRASSRELGALNPPADVVASFGIAAPPGSVVWMQSVHAAWVEISRNTRGPAGRIKQRMNPFHPVVLKMERDQLQGRQYRKLIALTDQVSSDIQRHYGVPAHDIEVLPNGYSGTEFHCNDGDTRARMRSQLGYGPDERVVVFVANEMERKGFAPLLNAVAMLRDPSIRVLAVGRLNERQGLHEAERHGLGDRVTFTGPTSDVANYYAASDVFALPTKYEAWGLVIVEAMACGLPVLTTRLAGASIAVDEGHNGLLLDQPADAAEIAGKLRRLLDGEHDDPEGVSRSVEQYEWSRLLLDYERILTENRN